MQRAAINKESQNVIEKGERKGEDMQDFDMEVYLQKLLASNFSFIEWNRR